MEHTISLTEQLLGACRELGKARVILRNSFGLAEGFGELSELEIRDGWLHFCRESFHLHVQCHTLTSVHFNECRDGKHNTPAYSISFCDLAGVALLVFALDQTRGTEILHQARHFRHLRDKFGPIRLLMSEQGIPAQEMLH